MSVAIPQPCVLLLMQHKNITAQSEGRTAAHVSVQVDQHRLTIMNMQLSLFFNKELVHHGVFVGLSWVVDVIGKVTLKKKKREKTLN